MEDQSSPSTGPTTPEGKARSARNAEKHGMYSSAVLLHYESAEAFAALRDSYYAQFSPATPAERDLVDTMIAATWRARRYAALESAALDLAIDSQRSEIDATYEAIEPEARAHLAFDLLTNDGATLAAYGRQQAAQQRHYHRALRNLLTLRGATPAENKK